MLSKQSCEDAAETLMEAEIQLDVKLLKTQQVFSAQDGDDKTQLTDSLSGAFRNKNMFIWKKQCSS